MSIDTRPVPQTPDLPSAEGAAAAAPGTTPARRMRLRGREADVMPRGIISASDWQSPLVRRTTRTLQALLLVGLVIWAVGPLYWLFVASISAPTDSIAHPTALWPSQALWRNISDAWTQLSLAKYFKNTIVLSFGSWLAQIVVATTGGYALSVLRPKYGKVLYSLVLATLFIPTVVILVPLFGTIVSLPIIHTSLQSTYWAIWLPAGANAFNVVLIKRFFDNLPREIFEAARVDGAGAFRLFWNIVLPMSRPVLGVVSVFAFIASWKDFLWPFLILGSSEDRQPLSVRLPLIAQFTDRSMLLAGMFLSTLLPLVVFAVFQRVFLRNQGIGGALKG
jgi:multiple sugar transport system permease protein